MKKILFVMVSFLIMSLGNAKNLHLIERDKKSGFEIYRSGSLSEGELKEMCDLGISEIMVLSGNAEDVEVKFQYECPNMKVIEVDKQDTTASVPLSTTFLKMFDAWVQDAQINGKKIAFRCNCGCHRTGRLAAYYQMKYQKLTSDDAIAIMMEWGKRMWMTPYLKHQVYALEDYINGRPCGQKEKYCVRFL